MARILTTISDAIKITKNTPLNLKKMGNNAGVVELTIRNTGTVKLIIADTAMEELLAGETFTLGSSNHLSADEKFQLNFEFTGEPDEKAEAIVRYKVPKCFIEIPEQ